MFASRRNYPLNNNKLLLIFCPYFSTPTSKCAGFKVPHHKMATKAKHLSDSALAQSIKLFLWFSFLPRQKRFHVSWACEKFIPQIVKTCCWNDQFCCAATRQYQRGPGWKSRGCLNRTVASVSGSQCFFLSNYFFYRFQLDHVTDNRQKPIQSRGRHYPLCSAASTHWS